VPLTDEEQLELDRMTGGDVPRSTDSIRLALDFEWENETRHKRLYVASGMGGVAQLNLDDQNGLQTISDTLLEGVRDIAKQNYSLFASRATGADVEETPNVCSAAFGPSGNSGVVQLNYLE